MFPYLFQSYAAVTQHTLEFFLFEFLTLFYVAIPSKLICVGEAAVFPVQLFQVNEGQVCVDAVLPVLYLWAGVGNMVHSFSAFVFSMILYLVHLFVQLYNH